jgi:hypothetical protein
MDMAKRLYAEAASHGMKEAQDRLDRLVKEMPAGAPGSATAARDQP